MPTEEQTQWNTSGVVSAGSYGAQRRGQRLTIPNRRVTHLSFIVWRYTHYGSHPNYYTYWFQIIRVSDGAVIASTPTQYQFLLPASPTWITHPLSAPVVINEEVRICVYATLAIGGQFYISAAFQNSDIKPGGSYSHQSDGSAVWTDYPAMDMAYKYTYELGAPGVSTKPVIAIAASAATLNGRLDDDGGEPSECGFEWGETTAYGNTTPTQSRTTGQTFAQTLTGLDPNKTYHVRAFAVNSVGTSYGGDRTFSINSLTLYARCRKGTQGWAFPGGVRLVVRRRSTGDTWEGSSQSVTSTGYGYFSENWAACPWTGLPWRRVDVNDLEIGISLLGNWTSGYESNTYCTQLYIEMNFGGVTTIVRPNGRGSQQLITDGYPSGRQDNWANVNEEAPDEDASYAHEGNFPTTGWNRDLYSIPAVTIEPAVSTDPATAITTNAATLNGTLDDDGGEPCNCGFEWGVTDSYGNVTPVQDKTTGEHFSQVLTGLEPDTIYHYRAIASNVFGLSHGMDRTFRTLSLMQPPYLQDPLISLLEEDTL